MGEPSTPKALPPAVIVVTDHTDRHLVELSGEFDVSNVQELKAAFVAASAAPGEVVVDLCETTFIDSTVLAQLVWLHRVVGRRLTVRCADGAVKRVLHLSGAAEFMTVTSP